MSISKIELIPLKLAGDYSLQDLGAQYLIYPVTDIKFGVYVSLRLAHIVS